MAAEQFDKVDVINPAALEAGDEVVVDVQYGLLKFGIITSEDDNAQILMANAWMSRDRNPNDVAVWEPMAGTYSVPRSLPDGIDAERWPDARAIEAGSSITPELKAGQLLVSHVLVTTTLSDGTTREARSMLTGNIAALYEQRAQATTEA